MTGPGIFIAQWTAFGFLRVTNLALQWRLPLAFPAAFAGVAMLMIPLIPESPRVRLSLCSS
jgi:hypothetical protein